MPVRGSGKQTAVETVGLRSSALLLAAALLAALAATWPLVLAPGSAIPRGTELTGTPMLHDLWSLWWTADRAAHGFQGIWNAPIFFPQQGAFTFSDPKLLLGVASAPLWALGLPPALCYNFVLVAVLALNGLAAGRLALALGAGRPAAAIGSVLAAALPFTAKMSGVLTVLSFFGLLFAVEGLVRFSGSGSWRTAFQAVCGFAVQCLSAEQIALLGAPLLLLASWAALAGRGFTRAATLRLALAAALALALVLAVLAPTLRVHRELGFARSESAVSLGSATIGDFFTRPLGASVGIPPRESLERDPSGLFPGVLLLLLAAAGALDGFGRRSRWTLVLVVAAGAAAVVALGLNVNLFGWRPFAWLRAGIPWFSELRSPFRSATVVQALLAVLAALGIEAAGRRCRGPAWRSAILGLGLLGAAENLSVPAALFPIPATPGTAWTAWLRSQPRGGAAVHLPLPGGGSVAAFEIETWRMFRQIDHRVPLLNGYAAYFPAGYEELQKLLGAAPTYSALCALSKTAGVTTVIVDRQSTLSQRLFEDPEVHRLLTPAFRDDAVLIFRLVPSGADCIARP